MKLKKNQNNRESYYLIFLDSIICKLRPQERSRLPLGILLFLSSTLALADPPRTLSQQLFIITPDRLLQQRAECRQTLQTQGAAQFLGQRNTLIKKLAGDFCDRPQFFCTYLNNMNQFGADPHLIDPECNPGYFPLNTLEALGRDGISPYMASILKESWNCVETQIPHPEDPHRSMQAGQQNKIIRYTLQCEAKWLKTKIPDFLNHLRKAVENAHGTLKLDSEKITFSFEAKDSPTTLKTLKARGDYLLDVASSIFRDPEKGFLEMARGVFTPSRIALLNQVFISSKNGAKKYLGSMGIPKEIIERVDRTQLTDYSFLRRENWTAEETTTFEHLERQCHGGRFGAFNAFNGFHSGRNRIQVCPTALALADLGNPKTLALVLTHELGHSIDPCALGKLELHLMNNEERACPLSVLDRNPNVFMPKEDLPSDPARKGLVLSFLGRVHGSGGFVECLHRAGYVQQASAKSEQQIQDLLTHDDCLTPQDRCYLKITRPGQPLSSCQVRLPEIAARYSKSLEHVTAQHCPKLRSALERIHQELQNSRGSEFMDLIQANQELEAFPDFLAAGAAVFVMNDPIWNDPLSRLDSYGKKADLITALAGVCWLDSHNVVDAHPVGSYRISIFSSAPRVRSLMGCAQTDSRSVPGGPRDMISPRSCEDRLRFGFAGTQ
jgi:hypothetical protein